MIHHVSIAARDPKHVADVLAELMQGRNYPFPGGVPDSWIAVSGDPHGTAIEVYPEDIRLRPDGRNAVRFERGAADDTYVPFHLLLSVPSDQATIEQIGAREGWTTRFCPRGAPKQKPLFNVIEFWVENRIMLELAPHDMIGDYEQMLQFALLDRMPASA
ncbi:MAG TPA: hypothetical protein VGG99_05985 [Acetobacteraceae bacterium]|jgi:hypothetical protein